MSRFKSKQRRCSLEIEILEDRLVCSTVTAPAPELSVPAYSSLPGAPATLYLDFNGHDEAKWGSWENVHTPVFDRDGNPASFNNSEKDAIKEIWQRVSEAFAPFNLNVTTVVPADFSGGKTLRIAIGGSPEDWYDNGNGAERATYGVSFNDSFTGSDNTGYVFYPKRDAKDIAKSVAHEAGHCFGLEHQSTFNTNEPFEEYNPGSALKAPIMGSRTAHPEQNLVAPERWTWWEGWASHDFHSVNDPGPLFLQDDMERIGRPVNGFGFRPDDHGDGPAGASPLLFGLMGGTSGSGIIASKADQDWFSFTAESSGQATFTVNGVAVGATLDARLELYRATSVSVIPNLTTPILVATADPSGSLNATITATLVAGTRYYVVVRSHGQFGDVGHYTLTGKIPGRAMLAPASVPTNVALVSAVPQLQPSAVLVAMPSLAPTIVTPIQTAAASAPVPMATSAPVKTASTPSLSTQAIDSALTSMDSVQPTSGLTNVLVAPLHK